MLISMSIGSFVGGVLISGLKLGRLGALKVSTLLWMVTVILPILYYFLACDNVNYVGLE